MNNVVIQLHNWGLYDLETEKDFFDMRKWVKKQDALQTKFNNIQAAWMEKDIDKVYQTLSACMSDIISLTIEIGKDDELKKDFPHMLEEERKKLPPAG